MEGQIIVFIVHEKNDFLENLDFSSIEILKT
jgi:hypothetical protein